jgi:hypothetical protein
VGWVFLRLILGDFFDGDFDKIELLVVKLVHIFEELFVRVQFGLHLAE